MNCTKSDMGDCCGKCGNKKEMKIIAVIPVLGRRELVRHTIERLFIKNKVSNVICVGDHPKDEIVCKSSGAEWVNHPNKTLGAKWNAGFVAAKKHNPDACLFVGSSDWVSDNWIHVLSGYMEEFDLVGLPGCYLLDIKTKVKKPFRACYWPGYVGPREGESIGIGRLISARILNKINWQPFDSHLEHSLDYSMVNRVTKAGGKINLVQTDDIKSMAVSCDQWPNKHNFESHWSNRLQSKRIDADILFKLFPESLQIFK